MKKLTQENIPAPNLPGRIGSIQNQNHVIIANCLRAMLRGMKELGIPAERQLDIMGATLDQLGREPHDINPLPRCQF